MKLKSMMIMISLFSAAISHAEENSLAGKFPKRGSVIRFSEGFEIGSLGNLKTIKGEGYSCTVEPIDYSEEKAKSYQIAAKKDYSISMINISISMINISTSRIYIRVQDTEEYNRLTDRKPVVEAALYCEAFDGSEANAALLNKAFGIQFRQEDLKGNSQFWKRKLFKHQLSLEHPSPTCLSS